MATNNSINNTIYENDFSVNRSVAGTAVESSVDHSDNTNAASHARLLAQTGGGSGGDPFIRLNVSGAQDYAIGIDNTDSDSLKIQDDADPSTGNNLWKMTSSGERIMPLQPSFYAYLSANATNVTGDATVYTIAYNTETYDQGGDFNTGTYTFTAPVTGRYYLGVCVNAEDLDAAAYSQHSINIATSNHALIITILKPDRYETSTGTAYLSLSGSALTDMDAADTAYVILRVSGGVLSVDVQGAINYTNFSGALIC